MDTMAALGRARLRFAEGDVAAAVSLLERCVEADPAWPEPRLLLAELYRRSGDLIEAGRWGYLLPDATAEESAAFERALVRSGEDPFDLAERALVSPQVLAAESAHAARMLAALPGRLFEAADHEGHGADPLVEGEDGFEITAAPPPRRGRIDVFFRAVVAGLFVAGGVAVGGAIIVGTGVLVASTLLGPG